MTHQKNVPCVPFDQCPICLAERKAQRAMFRTAHATHDPAVEHNFIAEMVMWHLMTDCDTPEKARELALVEWRVGVMGEKA